MATAIPGLRPVPKSLISVPNQKTQQAVLSEDPMKFFNEIEPIWGLEAEMRWLIPDLLVEGSFNLLAAESGIGKTWLSYFLAGAVARGTESFGAKAVERRVIYFDGENPLFNAKQRLFDMDIRETPNLKIWGGWSKNPPPKPNDVRLKNFARAAKPLLIWDSLIEFHEGDEQSATDIRAFMKNFRELTNLGATVIILHHTGKSDTAREYRGSSDIKGAVDTAWTLKALGGREAGGVVDKLVLTPFKNRLWPMKKLEIQLVKGQGFVKLAEGSGATGIPPLDIDIVVSIVRAKPDIKQGEVIRKAGKVSANRLAKQRVLEILDDPSLFTKTRGEKNSWHYRCVGDLSEPIEGEQETFCEA
jgi:hypothetical protein